MDPYYLTHKAQQIGYDPEIILAGRRLNDSMGNFVAQQVIKLMLQKRTQIYDARILILGLAFKENCPDTRNTRVKDIIEELKSYNTLVDVYDPWVDPFSVKNEHQIEMIEVIEENTYDGIVIAVAHQQFKELGARKIKAFGKKNSIIYDIKSLLSAGDVDGRL